MEAKVLNPTLYRRCVATFKHVRIRSQGVSAEFKNTYSIKESKTVKKLEQPGEYYVVCCPLCNDTRFRCNINHLYGTKDENNRLRENLVYCFNAGCPLCDKRPEAYEKMKTILIGRYLTDLNGATVRAGKSVDLTKIRTEFPGTVARIDKLEADHPAITYLTAKRNFDIDVLAANYDIHFCTKHEKNVIDHRLVTPIYFKGKMVGWQTRAIFDCDWKKCSVPKYFTANGTPKKKILYNYDNAIQFRSTVVFEGVTDVWRFGQEATCTLGTGLSDEQIKLIADNFDSAALVYDPDVNTDEVKLKSIDEAVAKLSSKLKYGFCRVSLAGDSDPADLNSIFLRRYIKAEAKKQGVKLFFERKKNETNS